MLAALPHTGIQQTTSYKVVLPFYIYAALSFVVATALLLLNTDIFYQHYFTPKTLAITHVMALGWGTMIILGASHQLLPVLIEGKLDSELLAWLSFICAAVGIPHLVTGFYIFHTGWLLQCGAVLVNAAVVFYLVNVISSIYESRKLNVYTCFIATATLWLFATTFFGLMLVFNFTRTWLPESSLEYLSLHAHMGLAGWFLLMVLGVGSRLIPMFLISKYTNNKMLWGIYGCINAALVAFAALRLQQAPKQWYMLSALLVLIAILLFAGYCYKAYRLRIRKKVDRQVNLSLLSVALLFVPLLSLLLIIYFFPAGTKANMILLYGFCIFFGWITAIILGMTFKTLPFIIWNKVYHDKAAAETPTPKALFSESLFRLMALCYAGGFILFATGIIVLQDLLLKAGAVALLAAAIFYVGNVVKTISHKAA